MINSTPQHHHSPEQQAAQQWLSLLGQYPKYGSKVSLHRSQAVLQRLIPASYFEHCKIIMITGTNGKGSTSMITSQILKQTGIHAGLLTSPHFIQFNERIQIASTPVDYQQILTAYQHLAPVLTAVAAELQESFIIYEVLFLTAMVVFYQAKVDTLIIEAGIGGRYDPGRILKPLLTALTSVDLDHTEILGASTDLIAFDKLDACYPQGTVVLGNIEPRLRRKIDHYATLNSITLVDASDQVTVDLITNPNTLAVTVAGQGKFTVTTPLMGDFQRHNIKTALSLCQHYFIHYHQDLPAHYLHHCQTALEQVRVPGRFEQVSQQPALYVDAAHSNEAYQLFFDSLTPHFDDQPLIFITGQSVGRDHQTLVKCLHQYATEIVVSQAHTRGQAAEILHQQLAQFAASLATDDPQPVLHLYPDLADAISHAKLRATQLNGRIFVVGGLFLAGEVAAMAQGLDPKVIYSL